MSKYPTLLSPINVAGVELRSRTLQSGMVSNLATRDGIITDRHIAYHVERAKNGVGLQIVGASYIEKRAQGYAYQVAIDRDECIEGLTKLTEAVHAVGGKMGIQIWHGGTSANPMYTHDELVTSSDCTTMMGLPARGLTAEEIKDIVKKFGDAAERAKKAGFDLIEIHGTHGYLIEQFYSPATNQRTDEYGGSLENRCRFPMEVALEMRARVGKDFPISFRITGDEYAQDAPGNTVNDAIYLANRLVDEAGIQVINVSGPSLIAIGTSAIPEAMFAGTAAQIKAALGGKALVSVANRIKRPEVAEQILASGMTDLVTIGRALICDPEFLTKAAEGREEDIRMCTSCAYCIARMMNGDRAACIQNPLMGREFELDYSPAPEQKNIIVVGSGPAGLQSAITAAKRGHNVTVYEAADKVGGKVNIAQLPPMKYELDLVIKNLAHEAEKLGVEIKLNTTATKDAIVAAKPDSVVVATGAVPVLPPIPGLEQDNVAVAQDILLGNKTAVGKAVVIGGGTVGIEVADYLLEKGNEVVVVEMQANVMSDLFIMQQLPYMQRVLPRLSACMTNTKVLEVKDDKVITDQGEIEGVGTVVVAAGYKSVNALAAELQEAGLHTVIVGDAGKPAKIYEATTSAQKAVYNIHKGAVGAYDEKVAVITGGAGGIARGYAIACAREGMKIVLVDIQAERQEKQAQELREKYGAEVVTFVADVTKEEEVQKIAKFTMDTYGRVDMVFNNAGIHFHKSFCFLTNNDFEFMIRSNIWSIIYGMRTFLPLLNENEDGGTIINTASGAAVGAMPSMSHYNLAKFAVLGMSQAVCQEERLYNSGKVNILVVMPSFVTSNLMDGAAIVRPEELKNPVEKQTFFDKIFEGIFMAAVNPKPEGAPLFNGGGGQAYEVPNEDAGKTVMDAIKAGKQFVFTHPETADVAKVSYEDYARGYLTPMSM